MTWMTQHPKRERVDFDQRYPIDISESIGVDSGYQKLHYHDAQEINLIKSGSGFYIINGERYEFGAGDIFMLNSNDLHCAYETRDLVILVIMFDAAWFYSNLQFEPQLLAPFSEIGLHFTNKLDCAHEKAPLLRELLHEMQREHDAEQASYGTVVYAKLLCFLSYFNRYLRQENLRGRKSAVSEPHLEKIRTVLDAIHERYAHPWTLEELAASAYLSPSHFSSLFVSIVGMSPIEYLIRLRLDKACHMLKNSDEKIVNIAMECGFRTLSNFNRLFKRNIGTEPRRFRDPGHITVR